MPTQKRKLLAIFTASVTRQTIWNLEHLFLTGDPKINRYFSGWWFQTWRLYLPQYIRDNPSHWLSYFSRWWKPPTRFYSMSCHECVMPFFNAKFYPIISCRPGRITLGHHARSKQHVPEICLPAPRPVPLTFVKGQELSIFFRTYPLVN